MINSCMSLSQVAPPKRHINIPSCNPNFKKSGLDCTDKDGNETFISAEKAESYNCMSPDSIPDILR